MFTTELIIIQYLARRIRAISMSSASKDNEENAGAEAGHCIAFRFCDSAVVVANVSKRSTILLPP
uniref:Uncharacterized protein n=1 Tax=Glossina austeni TaxID=7395 RepID=A0A1A9UFG1_GLOAU